MPQTKIAYVAVAPVYQTDRRGNTKVISPGTEIAAKVFNGLTDNQKAKFSQVEKATGRVRFNGGLVTDLPTVDGVVKTAFIPGEYHLLPVMVAELVSEVQELWEAAYSAIPFPGIMVGRYNGDDHLAWFINVEPLNPALPPMYTTSNHMCGLRPKKERVGQYPYNGASLLKVAERLRAGRPVFATVDEAIDRLLAA